MRSTLALAGLAAAAATFLAPVAPASAYCGEPIIVLDDDGSGCTNSCYETGYAYEKVRTSTSAGEKLVPSYWDVFSCLA